MSKLSILLLIYVLSVGSANAARMEPIDVSAYPSGASNYVLDISNDGINLTTPSKFPQNIQFTSETDTATPDFWIVGLGLCLIFLGFKMKTNPSK